MNRNWFEHVLTEVVESDSQRKLENRALELMAIAVSIGLIAVTVVTFLIILA